MSSPSEVPVATPAVPVGVSTKASLTGAAGLALAALVSAVLQGDHSRETVYSIVGIVVLLVVTQIMRSIQSFVMSKAGTEANAYIKALEVQTANTIGGVLASGDLDKLANVVAVKVVDKVAPAIASEGTVTPEQAVTPATPTTPPGIAGAAS